MVTKICAICNGKIKPKDDYCRITDYKKGIFYIENFYHTICYNKQIRGENPQQKVAMGLLDKVNKLLNRIGVDEPEPKKVYDLV